MAIIGLGRMGRFHAAALATVDEVEVVALVEPFADALDQAAALVPGATCYSTVSSGLAHLGLRAVLIAASTPVHPDLVQAALEAGLHVLCEKPLALDDGDARRLASLAAERDLVLQVGFWRRFAPPWRVARTASTLATSASRSSSASLSGTRILRRPPSATRR